MKTTPPPDSVLATIRHWLLRGDDLQQTRRHVVKHHGRAEWEWLSTTTTERHAEERAQAARWLRDIRTLARYNDYTPRLVFRLARAAR
jgi:hypothetical protein